MTWRHLFLPDVIEKEMQHTVQQVLDVIFIADVQRSAVVVSVPHLPNQQRKARTNSTEGIPSRQRGDGIG